MAYPTEEERARIIARRKQVQSELIGLLVMGDLRRSRKSLERLVRQYGQAEVERVLGGIQKAFDRDLAGERVELYREYVAYYRRFGRPRPWLTLTEFTAAQDEFDELYARNPLAPAEALPSSVHRLTGASLISPG